MATELPNIALIMTDQQKASATSIYGNRVVRTPSWARLADEGVTFDSCFANSSVCTPSRASLMTGLDVPVHQATSNRNKISPEFPQLSELLGRAGYHCGVVGHHDGFAGLNRGWDWEVDWWDRRRGLCQIFYEVDELSKSVKPLRGWISGVHPRPADQGLAARMTDYAIQYVDEIAQEPFFLHLAHLEPHPPYFPPEPYASMYSTEGIILPPSPDPAHQPQWQKEAAQEMLMHQATEHDMRLAIARYYGLVSYVDAQIGRFIEHLEQKGLLDRTWIFLVSDHGDFTGEHGLFTKSHALYDCLTHVPMVIRPPDGYRKRGRRIQELAQVFDLFPTICEIAGVTVPQPCHALSLNEWLEDGSVSPIRDSVFMAVGGNANPRASFPQGMPLRGVHREVIHAIRTHSRKYIRDPENGDEFYRLSEDPHELVNLSGIATASEMQPLKEALDQWAIGR